MDTHLESVFPTQLTLEDLIWDDHDGHHSWCRVVGLAADGEFVIATCEGDGAPVRLPVSRPVRVRHRAAEPLAEADREAAEDDIISGYYAGDVESAVAAAAQPRPTPVRSVTTAAEPHYDGVYGGDLDHIVDALGTTPADRDARDRRAAAYRRRAADAAKTAEVDDAAAADANESVDERMAGWYAGDIDALRHKDD